jgi:hypothetical protein
VKIEQIKLQNANTQAQRNVSKILNENVTPFLIKSLEENNMEQILIEGKKLVNAYDKFNVQQ